MEPINSISSLDVEDEEVDASVVDALPKAMTMKEVILSCGRRLAVSVVIIIALAGKGLLHIQYKDPVLVLDGTGTDVTSQRDDDECHIVSASRSV